MTWEWVAPVATGITGSVGVYFTWLTGAQARKQTDAMTHRQEEQAERARITEERKSAYLAALELASINLRRARYKREGRDDKLKEIELKWPKAERVHMEIQVGTRVSVYGSRDSRDFVSRWNKANDADDEAGLKQIYEEALALVRHELGTESFEVGGGSMSTTGHPLHENK